MSDDDPRVRRRGAAMAAAITMPAAGCGGEAEAHRRPGTASRSTARAEAAATIERLDKAKDGRTRSTSA
jgi:hypothetical protein